MSDQRRLLGVLVPDRLLPAASELFELFKTAWEPAQAGVEYEVVLTHNEAIEEREGNSLTIVTGGPNPGDRSPTAALGEPREPGRVTVLGLDLDLLHEWHPVGTGGEPAAWSGPRHLRIGYDLFAEIHSLLSTGQQVAQALRATCGRHVEVLRRAMTQAGLPVVEVDAQPAGKRLTVALTHDVDFARLRNHRFDRTAAGFFYRATVGTIADFFRGRARLDKVRRNLAAAIKLPLVYLGLATDPWNRFADYAEVEAKWRSTFFIIPRAEHPGVRAPGGTIEATRACRYQASEVAADLMGLERAGFEVGLHGLDAWTSAEQARTERLAIQEASGAGSSGVRMHWLYFDASTYHALEDAGFDYDSTFGFNDAIGFRAGTGLPFRPLGTERLLELPLIIQDTALFYARRMRLDEKQAWALCQEVIDEAQSFGGAVTLLWHMRSIGPERWWGDFYRRLLEELEARGAWLAPAADIIAFARKRRAVRIDASIDHGVLTVNPQTDDPLDDRISLLVRFPGQEKSTRLPFKRQVVDLAVPA